MRCLSGTYDYIIIFFVILVCFNSQQQDGMPLWEESTLAWFLWYCLQIQWNTLKCTLQVNIKETYFMISLIWPLNKFHATYDNKNVHIKEQFCVLIVCVHSVHANKILQNWCADFYLLTHVAFLVGTWCHFLWMRFRGSTYFQEWLLTQNANMTSQ